MRLLLPAVFIVFPLVEIALLIKLGAVFGFWTSFAIVIGTAVAGSMILQRQGFAVLSRSQDAMAQGRLPIEPVIDGLFLLIAGLLLISPGLISDCLGLLLLVPPLRRVMAHWLLRRYLGLSPAPKPTRSPSEPRERVWRRTAGSRWTKSKGASSRAGPAAEPPVIEGEFERVDEPGNAKSAQGSKKSSP